MSHHVLEMSTILCGQREENEYGHRVSKFAGPLFFFSALRPTRSTHRFKAGHPFEINSSWYAIILASEATANAIKAKPPN